MRDAGRIGFAIKGAYNSTETYEFLDVVYHNGSSYVAKKETTGNAPVNNNEFWQILARGESTAGDADASDMTVEFEQAASRTNITTGEKLSVMFGKIKKWFSDLKPHCFISPVNNLLATVAGTALDAVQGKAINDRLTQLNSDLSRKEDNITAYCTFNYHGDKQWISSPIPIVNADKYKIALSGNVKNTTEENTHVISGSYFTIHKYRDYFYLVTDNESVAGYIFGTVAPGIVWEIPYNVANL